MRAILPLSMFFHCRQHVWKRNNESGGRRGGRGGVSFPLGGGGDFLLFIGNRGLLMIKKKIKNNLQRVWSPGRHHAFFCL